MLRRRLIWRLVAPTLLLSVLLLLMGGGAAWYVHQGDLRTAEALDKGIDAAFTSEELLLSIRDMRRHLDRYEATKDPAYIKTAVDGREQVNNYLRLVQSDPLNQTVAVKASLESMDRFKQQIFAELEQLPANPTTQQLNTLRNQISDHLVLPATQLLQNRRDFAKQGSFRNRVFVDHLRDGLVLLGICGALAGLIAGFAIARGFTRSLEQLGASAHEIMGTLGKFDHHSSTSASDVPARYGSAPQSLSENVDVLPDLQFTLKAVADRTALVVQELQNARKVSERSDQLAAIGQLAAGLAHELRNPLTSMKLLAQTALERQKGLAGHDLRILEEEISRLEQLLQTFLDFARPARLKIERLDLGVLVEQTVEFARRRAIQHQIVLAYECPEREILLEADATQIRQVVLNLLLNAIDAQQEGGTIRIGVSEEAGPRRLGMIVVADEGSGLPDGYGETIFDPFVSTKETGIGLGLSICKRIVESHGGYMTAANRAPQGAEFHVCLPLVNTDTENASPREIPSVSRP